LKRLMIIKRPALTLLRLPAYILLFMMLMFPMVLEMLYIKALLFILLLYLVVIATMHRGRLRLHPLIGLWALFMTSAVLFFALEGFFIADTHSVLQLAQVYGLWPLVYLVLISGAVDSKIWIGVQRTMVISTICIATYGLLYFFTELQILPRFIDLNFFAEESAPAIGFREGYIGMRVLGLSSLPFLIPFCMAALIVWVPEKKGVAVKKSWLWVAVILGIALVIISRRRALWLVFLLTPLCIYLLLLFLPKTERLIKKMSIASKVFFFCVLLVALNFSLRHLYEFDLAKMAEVFVIGFNISDTAEDIGALDRFEQLNALIRGWMAHPLIGVGLGASAEAYGSVRSELPWAYELSYLALLYQVGIVGFIIFASGVIWIYRMGIKIINRDSLLGISMLPILVGMSTLLIANATNPYLVRFDGLWAIFLPLIPINNWLLNQRQQKIVAPK